VVRIPVGFGKKTGDPWHSVTGEAVYAHTLGWRIAFPSNAEDAVGLLRTALRSTTRPSSSSTAPCSIPEGRKPYPATSTACRLGLANRLAEGDELTVVTWGAIVPRCLQAARAFPGG
jgi:2-oxoisovalerate dehydrogenase E1 component